jgi:hypothetical protein
LPYASSNVSYVGTLSVTIDIVIDIANDIASEFKLFAKKIEMFYLKNRLHSLIRTERECVCGSRLEQAKKMANQKEVERKTSRRYLR